MKHSPRHNKNLRTAMPFLVALLLVLAILPAAVFAQPPGPGGPGSGPGGPGSGPPSTDPPTATPTATTGPGSNPGGGGPSGGPPGGGQPGVMPSPTATAVPANNNMPHPSAPFTPPANCIVAHAATPAQLCPIDGGLQYYFIGADGSAQPGPWIQPFSELAALASWSVYSGTNAKTGKSVTITYLAAENMIRISTFYPDNEYDTDKPYTFTVDSSYAVNHEAW